MSENLDENGQSPASVPDSQKYFIAAKEGNPLIYSGSMEGETFTFYFNLNNLSFLCEGRVENADVKMSGVIELETEGKVKCYPKYGIMPESEEWIDTSGEEVKEFNILGNEVSFEGITMKKIS